MSTKIGVVLPYRNSDELVDFVEATLDLAAELEIVGAQDGLTDDDLRELSRGVPPGAYLEMLSDGSVVYLTHECVAENFGKQARLLLNRGCDAVMICCSMEYPELDVLDRVVTPMAVMKSASLAILPQGGTLGVMQPIEESKDVELLRWQAFCADSDLRLVSVVASPEVPGAEEASEEGMAAAACGLVDQRADVIVLDCMAYTDKHRRLVAEATGKPTLRPMSLTASLIAEAFLID